ncbi:hypothetical protein ACQP25_29385 [Microtetraspora malaysiensis]|uniref:hypothetical protein n=1 Tax=Microtetraspora malaysiensis TaxID=161358 RepID=UPI003D8C9208
MAELEREPRTINGQDPEIGRYPEPGPASRHPLARTSHEARPHMDLTPCPCGGSSADTTSVAVNLGDGETGRRYTRICRECGAACEFVYRLPAGPYVPAGPVGFGCVGGELCDPGRLGILAGCSN